MRESIIEIANIYTFYELTGFLSILLICSVSGVLLSYRISKERKISLLFVTQPIIFLILFTAVALLAEYYFLSIRNGYQQIGILTGFAIVMTNLVIYSIEYIRGKREKIFDPDRVNRRHFSATLNNIIILIILACSYGFFSPEPIGQVILVTSAATIVSLTLNHLIIRKLFRDPTDIKKS